MQGQSTTPMQGSDRQPLCLEPQQWPAGSRPAAHDQRHRAAGVTAGGILLLATLLVGLGAFVDRTASAQTRASMQQIQEAWLASDAVVYGVYRGVDPQAGLAYHAIDVEEVWIGTAAPGPLLFKAPRGIQAEAGDTVLLMFWDELNGATHAFLEKSRRNYGEELWSTIGPDSLTTYLLPFSRFAFQFHKGKIDLRGTGVFIEPVKRKDLRRDLVKFELQLLPGSQFQSAEAVVEAFVTEREFKLYEVEEVTVEHRVLVQFARGVVHKGEVPAVFEIEYGSFPRSPRFETDDSVLLFLERREDSWFLPYGKRSVYHIGDGQVLEAGQPLREFLKAMRTTP